MANRKLFDINPLTTSPNGTTMRIAIGNSGTTAQNMTLNGFKTWLGLTGISPTTILTKAVCIGSWNMDTTRVKCVSTGVALSKLRAITDITIISDSCEMFAAYYRNSNWELSLGVKVCCTPSSNALVAIERNDGYFFDQSGFNNTAMNRGWIMVHYVC